MRVFLIPAVVLLFAAPASAQFLGKSVVEWTRELESGKDPDRRSAAFALGKIGDPSSAAALKQALKTDSSSKVRDAAAFALGEIALRQVAVGKDFELTDVLTRALDDDDPLVRRSAAYALGCLAGDAAAARPAVERALGDKRPEVRQSAAWALGRLGDKAVPALAGILSDRDPFVLRDAVNSLGQLDPEQVRVAIAGLARLANHSDPEVRKSTLLVMVRIVGPEDVRSPSITAPLQKALLDGDVECRRNAAFALSNIGGGAAAPAIDVLLDALGRGDLELRRQAAAAFGNLGPAASRAVPELVRCLKETDLELRTNAALALGGIGPRADAAVPPLVDLIASRGEDEKLRFAAATALSKIGGVPSAVDAVPKLLAVVAAPDDNGKVRERILWALRVHNVKLRDFPAVRPAFLKILTEPPSRDNRMVRQDCAYLASMIYGPQAPKEVFPVLLEYLKDDSLKVYRATASSVGGTAAETTSGKSSTREVGDGDGRKLALDALGMIGPTLVSQHPEIIAQVTALANSDRCVPIFRKQCADYLATVR